MRKYIDDYINTLSTRQQTRVGDLLAEARVAKSQLAPLLQVLQASDTQGFTPIILAPADADTLIVAQDFEANGTSMASGLADLFDVANLVSLLLESHAATLTSDIKAQEDELFALEKLADNYAFLLADNNAYDFAYLEPFNDESGRDQDDNPLPDRAGAYFLKQNASIRADEGMLTIPDFNQSHGLNVGLLKGNASAFASEKSPLGEMLKDGSSSGWKTQFRAGSPITSSLIEADGVNGAQIMLEFTLSQPAPASQIRLRPFSEQRVQLLRLTLYANDEEGGSDVIVPAHPLSLDRPTTVSFPLQTVSRFRVLLNQPVYERRGAVIPPDEEAYQQALQEIASATQVNNTRGTTYYWLNSVKKKRNRRPIPPAKASHSNSWNSLYKSVPFTEADLLLLSGLLTAGGMVQLRLTPGLSYLFTLMLDLSKADLMSLSNRNIDQLKNISRIFKSAVIGVSGPLTDILDSGPINLEDFKNEARVSNGYDYLYNMGLYNVAIGVDAPDYKAIFVSRPLPTEGDPGAIRIKASEVNYQDRSGQRNSPFLTSVEYSVSSKINPSHEYDWLPILPINSPEVLGERFFVDSGGKGYFRFPATSMASIHLYQNGMRLNISSDDYLMSLGNVKVLGISIPSGMWNGLDPLTVDYVPYQDATVVEFADFNPTTPPLTQAFDNDGVGEGFTATSGRYEISLQNTPYIDPVKVAESEYDYLSGMYPYQPIVVKTQSGVLATNLTNYGEGEHGVLPASGVGGYYFIQSGRALRFNQPISEPLRVYYQYIENNLRFRVVMRVNSPTFVSPKVDYVQLKAKTRKSIDRL